MGVKLEYFKYLSGKQSENEGIVYFPGSCNEVNSRFTIQNRKLRRLS